MGRGSLRLWGIAPTSENIIEAVRKFAREAPGRITALDDEWLGVAKSQYESEPEIDFASFSELVSTCLAYHGIRSRPLADEKQILEAVRKAVEESTEDSPYFESRMFPGVSRRLSVLLAMLRQRRFDYSIVAKLTGEPLSKTIALAKLSAGVSETMDALGLDLPESRIEKCLETSLPSDNALQRLLVFAGLDPSTIQLEWIQWAVEQGSNITLVVLSGTGLGGFEASNDIALRFGAFIEPIGANNPLIASLFTNDVAVTSLEIGIESTADALAECEWALRRCRQDLSRGLKPFEIGLFVRNSTDYSPLLRAASERIGIPLAIVRNEALTDTAFAQWLGQLLDSLRASDPRKLVLGLRSSYSGVSQDICDALRDAAADATRQGDIWAAFEPAARAVNDSTVEFLVEWRAKYIGAILNDAGWNSALGELFECVAIARLLESDSREEMRDRLAAQEAQSSFGRYVAVARSQEAYVYDSWIERLESICRLADVSIPPDPAGIRVANSPTQLIGLKSVHGLGFLEGMFPRRRSDDPLLSDEERREINVALFAQRALPDSHRAARAERDLFLLLCAAPTESLTLSYPAAGDERDNVPAFYLSELDRATGGRISRRHRRLGDWTSPVEWDASDQDRRLRESLNLPMVPMLEPTVISEEGLDIVRSKPGEAYFIAELREAAQCPFHFAFRRKLGLQSSDVGEKVRLNFLPRNIGLASIETKEEAVQRFQESLETQLSRARADLDSEDERLLRASARRAIDDWVRKEWVSRETWTREHGTAKRPASFGDPGLESGLKIDDETVVQIKGDLDEVGDIGPYRVAKMYNSRSAFLGKIDDWKEGEKLEAAIVFAAMGAEKPGAAIEFVDNSGDRVLVLKDRLGAPAMAANAKEGLKVLSLDARERKFMSEAKEIIRSAYETALSHHAEPRPGEHCEHCAYGEICRRSSQFGEQEWDGGSDEVE